MLKKLMNLLMILLIAVFIYNNYIKKQEEIKVDLASDVTTTGVQYNFDGYTVVADKQKDVAKNGSSHFDKAKALFTEAIVKGQTAVVDKLNNMVINDDVFGINEETGWKFESEELRYNKKKDKWTTDTGIKIYNEERKTVITAMIFTSDSSLIDMVLEKNVKIISEDKEILAEKAFYNSKTEILKLVGNVKVKNLNLNKATNFKEFRGNFPQVVYDMKNGVMTANGSNSVFYEDYVITSRKLSYYEKIDEMHLEGNVKIVRDTMIVTMKKATYRGNENKIYLKGRINGVDKEAEFESDNGEINTLTEDMILLGNVVVDDDTNKILADKVNYIKSEEKMEAIANADNEVHFITDNGEIFTNFAIYLYVDEVFKAPNDYRMTSEEVNGTGRDLSYNLITEKGFSRDLDYVNIERRVLADTGKISMISKESELEGNVKIFAESYIISNNKTFADDKNGKIKIIGDYIITKEDDPSIKVVGENLEYDSVQEFLFSKDDTYLYKTTPEEKVEIFGESFTYDMQNEIAVFDKFIGTEEIEDLKITGDKGTYLADDSITLVGNVKYYHAEYKGETEKLIYDSVKDKLYFPRENTLLSTAEKLNGTTQKGEYDLNTEVFYGEGFIGDDDKIHLESNYIHYDDKTAIAKLTGDVIVFEGAMKAESQEIIYYTLTDYAISEDEVVITKKNAELVAANAKLDMVAQTFESEDAVLTTTNGDFLKGDYVFADYTKNEFDIRGNLEAIIYTRNEDELNNKELARKNPPMVFKGELARVFFVENLNGDMFMSRGEIKKETEFIHKNMKLDAEFMEFDTSKEYVFGKGDSKLTLSDDDKMSAESIYINTLTEEGTLKENVKIFNVSEEAGEVNSRADRAFLDNQKDEVILEGNVEAYKGETKLTADNGVYDLETNQIEGKGNVLLSFDFQTAEQEEENDKRTADLNTEIDQAKEEIFIPEIIVNGITNIDLPRKINDVIIVWESDNEELIDNLGKVKHPDYDEKDVPVSIKATFTAADITQEKYYFTIVKKHSKETYLEEIASEYELRSDNNELFIQEEVEGIKLSVVDKSDNITDEFKLSDDLSEKMDIELLFAIEDISLRKKYESKYVDGILTFKEVKPKNE